MLARETTPSAIVRYLDQYVIGQEEAKKIVAVAVYTHYRKIAYAQKSAGTFAKSNILLIGPSGTGKTLLCDTLSRMLDVSFVTADATALAQTRYVNEEIEAILQRLVDNASGSLDKAQHGIVFIDEIDKLKSANSQSRAVSGESVQHALLKIMEGAAVKLKGERYLDTTHILFICGGAFIGLENNLDIIAWGLKSFRDAKDSLVKAKVQSGLKVRIIAPHPDSAYVVQREHDEKEVPGQIRQTILHLGAWVDELKSMIPDAADVQIRLIITDLGVGYFNVTFLRITNRFNHNSLI